MAYGHAALLAAVRRLAALPTATASGSADADLIAHANEVLQSEVAPFVMELREGYFLQTKSQAITSGTDAYRVPSRAMGLKLRDVGLKTSAGDFRSLPHISQDDLGDYSSEDGDPEGFYLRGGWVVLVPAPTDTSETLELPYFIRPNELVTTAYGTVSDITGSVVTYTETGTFAPTTSSVIDFVSAKSGFDCLSIDVTPSAADTTANTVTVTVPSGLAVGDYVVTAEQSPVPQIPAEFHPLLYVKTALRMAESNNQANRIGYLSQKAAALEDQIRRTFAPRVDGEPKIVSAGANGLLGMPDDWRGW